MCVGEIERRKHVPNNEFKKTTKQQENLNKQARQHQARVKNIRFLF